MKQIRDFQKQKHNPSLFLFFIREYGSIKKTPAEQAGIKLELGQNKIENLIKLASKSSQLYEKHPVFAEPENKDGKIWRYIDFTKFTSMIDGRSLFFVKASKLRDPYEGTMPEYNDQIRRSVYESQKQNFKDDDQFEKFLQSTPKGLRATYKQNKETMLINSWHENDYESASMWQLYSQGNSGIAIQSTFKKLYECFSKNIEDKIWIGKVKYLDFKKEWMDEGNIFDPFIIKRKSFSSEMEIRALTLHPEDPISNQKGQKQDRLIENGMYVPVDLEILIEKIYVSPFAQNWVTKTIQSVATKFHLNKEIIQSDLYALD